MSPYRSHCRPPSQHPNEEPAGDDRIVLWVALLVSLLGLIPRISATTPWGAEPTLALLIALGSALQLLRYALGGRRRSR